MERKKRRKIGKRANIYGMKVLEIMVIENTLQYVPRKTNQSVKKDNKKKNISAQFFCVEEEVGFLYSNPAVLTLNRVHQRGVI